MATFSERLKHAWNVFTNRDPTDDYIPYNAVVSTTKPDRPRLRGGNEKTIVTGIYNRIAIDVAATTIEHVKLDSNGRYVETRDSGLNKCLTLNPNIDQTSRAFFIDLVLSMFDEGCVAVVPVDTSIKPGSGSVDIESIRTGKILEWYPDRIRVRVYNENTGNKEDVVVPKKTVAIIENPLYAVMNERNSLLQRLTRKLALLDSVDEQTSAGKLDLIIQLPYTIKSEARKQQAEARKADIEAQLSGSKYGIAYTDATEHITQLNRSLENHLLEQIEYLQDTLYGQLGLTKGVFDGTAGESEMLNYYNRTIEPILAAITDEMERKFLTQTARTQKQAIYYFHDPFKLVPAGQLAEIADKFTRNEIMTANEFRQIIGLKPADDPGADELRNKNLYDENAQQMGVDQQMDPSDIPITQDEYNAQMKQLDSVDNGLDDLESMLGG